MQSIIHINGTSSCGKSTVVRALQESLDLPLLHTGIDHLLDTVPKKYFYFGSCDKDGFSWRPETLANGSTINHVKLGAEGYKMWEGLVQMTLGLLTAGNSVVIDDVAFLGHEQHKRWQEALAGHCVLWVAVHCPLDIIDYREKHRDKSFRVPGSAAAQYPLVHKDNHYDLEVDSSKDSVEDMVKTIIDALKMKQKKYKSDTE